MRAVARLGAMQARANGRMEDEFTAYSPSGTSTTDANGFEVPGYSNEGSTQGRIAGPSAQSTDTTARVVTIGGSERPVVAGGLHIPVSAPVPAVGEYGHGWEYVLTTLGAHTDPSLLDSRWLVVDAPAKSQATARRLDVVRLI